MGGKAGDIDAVLGFHIRLAHGAVLRHFAEHFAALGLTQKQVSVLWLTGDKPGVSQIDLAARMQMDRATTMAIVHALEGKGLIERRASATDRRRICLSLTTSGANKLDQARAAIAAHEAWLKQRFSAAEVDMLIELLARIHG